MFGYVYLYFYFKTSEESDVSFMFSHHKKYSHIGLPNSFTSHKSIEA